MDGMEKQLCHWFTYHAPTGNQPDRYEELRGKGYDLARTIFKLCPPCADTSAAIRKVREAVMTANAAIACGPDD